MQHTLDTLLERVTAIVAENLKIDPSAVNPDGDLIDDLNADSLDALSITMSLQVEMGVSINDEQMAQFRTPRKIARALWEQMQGDPQKVCQG